MTSAHRKTVAIFGAGPGLGASLATRFGKEGYQIALVARRPGPLDERVASSAHLARLSRARRRARGDA